MDAIKHSNNVQIDPFFLETQKDLPKSPRPSSNSSEFCFELDAYLTQESIKSAKICKTEEEIRFSHQFQSSKQRISKNSEDFFHSPHNHKQEKNVYYANSFESLSILSKEKISIGDQALEAPELTNESVISSDQYEKDGSCNGNQSPYSLANRINNFKPFHENSQGSDDLVEQNEKHRIYHLKHAYAQGKQSGLSDGEDIMTICQHCSSLFGKCKKLQAQNADIFKKNQILSEQLAKLEQNKKQELKRNSLNQKQEETSPAIIKDLFLFQIQESYKTLMKVNVLLNFYDIDLPQKDCYYLQKFCSQFKNIQSNVLGKEKNQQKKIEIEAIHANYKKLIKNLVKNFEQNLHNKDLQFKNFMSKIALKDTPLIKVKTLALPKVQRQCRKSKTYVQREISTQDDFIKSLLEKSNQKIQELELKIDREKQKCRQLQKNQKEQNQQYVIHLNQLIKDKNIHKDHAKKIVEQFSEFMVKLSQHQQKKQTVNIADTQFFKNISQRIFQVSNCIPFQDNDQQNMFAPESQSQLYEMIERIRKFYLKFQIYNYKRQNHYQTQKNMFICFIKKLIEQYKVSQNHVLQLLQNNQCQNLTYLGQLIYGSRSKLRKSSGHRQSKSNRFSSLKTQRAHSLIVDDDSCQI